METKEVADRAQLLRPIEDSRAADFTSIILLGQGFLNQLGADLPDRLPGYADRLKLIQIGVDLGSHPSAACRVEKDGALNLAVLDAIGESPELLTAVLAAIDTALSPRFGSAVLSAAEFYCYDDEADKELHLEVDEVREHFAPGTFGHGWKRSFWARALRSGPPRASDPGARVARQA